MAPTFETEPRFFKDLRALSPTDRRRFRSAVTQFIEDLRRGDGFRKGLRVKRVEGTADIWEMTFAPNGRATWQYGDEVHPGEPHVIWRRVGTHQIFGRP
ncbi:hypothetical protein JS278_02905 [Acidipropionibacterium virtanenii]|uniref:Uncharacterized protein n=1 Tax=Acidipropionibacterium virtanenii TaxID=2057246 RepID=A0A344UXP1_9ACTN|nr:hypothetical protein JS278_02905 [Acidipropionibacterium virtanenii]